MQRATGHSVGAPQQAHSGERTGNTERRQASQTRAPEREQTTQREGKTSSRIHPDHGTGQPVPCLCQLCVK